MQTNKNAVLIDFDASGDWAFKTELEKTTNTEWCVEKLVSNRNHGGIIQKLIRYFKYFLFPFKIFLKRREYMHILAWQQFYGLIFAFYCRLFKVKNSPDVVIMTFIYKEKKSLLGRIYFQFVNYALHSKFIKYIVIYSANEQAYYSKIFNLPREKFIVTKLGAEDQVKEFEQYIYKGEHYLSAGRSNRDYEFLTDNWNYKDKKIKIISDSFSCTAENIELLDNCYGDCYLKELSQCNAVILILQDENISSGQLVILNAMMLGKPVIVTANNSVLDYIVNDFNGIIINKNKQELDQAILKLEEPKFYEYISTNARKTFEREFSVRTLGRTIGNLFIQTY